MSAPFVATQKQIVRHHIKFLLGFSVDVGGRSAAKCTAERTVANHAGNRLARERDIEDKRVQLAARARMAAALLDQVLGERCATGEHGELLQASTFAKRGSAGSATSSAILPMIQSGQASARRLRSV